EMPRSTGTAPNDLITLSTKMWSSGASVGRAAPFSAGLGVRGVPAESAAWGVPAESPGPGVPTGPGVRGVPVGPPLWARAPAAMPTQAYHAAPIPRETAETAASEVGGARPNRNPARALRLTPPRASDMARS